MRDDSLAARLFSGHDYKGSLAGDSLVDHDRLRDMGEQAEQAAQDTNSSFFDSLAAFFASIPWVVYAVLGVILVAFLVYWAFRSGLLHVDGVKRGAAETADDIYEIDYDE